MVLQQIKLFKTRKQGLVETFCFGKKKSSGVQPAHLSHHNPLRQSCPCSHSVHCSAALWGYTCGFDRSSLNPNSLRWLHSSPHPSQWDTGFVRRSEPTRQHSRQSPRKETDPRDIQGSLMVLEERKYDTMGKKH